MASLSLPLPALPRLHRPLTDSELLQFCAANDGLRVERTAEGNLVVMTPAGGKAGNREGYLFRELDLWAEQAGKGIAFNSNTGFRLADQSIRVPDAAWLSRDTWDALSDQAQEGFIRACPAFVVELRSPSDRLPEIAAKMELWIELGAQLGWLIDLQRQVVMVYRPHQEPETLLKPECLEGEGLVAGFRLAMERFWK